VPLVYFYFILFTWQIAQNNSGTTIDDMVYTNPLPAQHNRKKQHSFTKYDDMAISQNRIFLQGFASVQHS
jgi:hypothetical protein